MGDDQSDFDGAFNFLIGGFYMESETDSDYWVVATGLDYFASLGAGVDGVGLVSPAFNSETDEYNITSTAFFGEVYYDISDTLKLTLGARYTIDEKDVNARSPLLSAGAQVLGANDLVTKPFECFDHRSGEPICFDRDPVGQVLIVEALF